MQATNTTKLRVFTKRLRLRPIALRFFLVGGLFNPDHDPDAPRANGANLENPKNPDFAGHFYDMDVIWKCNESDMGHGR